MGSHNISRRVDQFVEVATKAVLPLAESKTQQMKEQLKRRDELLRQPLQPGSLATSRSVEVAETPQEN